MKRKIVAVVCCVIMIGTSLCFTSCGKFDYTGIWTGESQFGTCSIEMNEDGSACVNIFGIDSEGTWEELEDGNVNIVTDEFEDIVVAHEGEQISTDIAGETVVFDKK